MNTKSLSLALAAFACLAAVGTAANASTTLAVQFFAQDETVANGDFGICCSSPPATLPVIALGSGLLDGMPVTTLAANAGGVIDQTPGGGILWWTPSQETGIAFTGNGAFTLGPLTNMYAPNNTGQNDSTFYETAILSGTLIGTGVDTQITVASDDDAFVYVDGLYVGGNPGVHGLETTTIDLGDLTGRNSLEIFYADRAQVGADLSVNVDGATVSVPEPATWAMMLVGFGGLGAGMRLRRKPAPAAA